MEIRNAQGAVLNSKSFKSSDGEHGRSVAKSAWTANSRFFVFSTASSGGHSPWHGQTYAYDRQKNTFTELDDTTGPIIKRNFQLTAPDCARAGTGHRGGPLRYRDRLAKDDRAAQPAVRFLQEATNGLKP